MTPESDLPFDTAFANDLAAGVSYEDALTKHVTGTGRVRRAACLQTLQAIAMLDLDTLQPLLMWARQQKY
jgi:hypothetical protein